MNEEEIANIRKLQGILAAIAGGNKIFFNVVQLRDKLKVIKEHGKDRGLTRWVLTEKGKMVLNFQI